MQNLYDLRGRYMDIEDWLTGAKVTVVKFLFAVSFFIVAVFLLGKYSIFVLIIGIVVWLVIRRKRSDIEEGFFVELPSSAEVVVTEASSEICYSDNPDMVKPGKAEIYSGVKTRTEKTDPDQHIRVFMLKTNEQVPELEIIDIAKEEPPNDAAKRRFDDVVKAFKGG